MQGVSTIVYAYGNNDLDDYKVADFSGTANLSTLLFLLIIM